MDLDWTPVWFKSTALPYSTTVEFFCFTLALIFLFFRFEKTIKFTADEQKLIVRRVVISTFAAMCCVAFSSASGFDLNLRDLSQQYSVNILYNFSRIFFVFFYVGLLGSGKASTWGLGLLIGFLNAYSGSKASILMPILVALMVFGKFNFKVVLVLVTVVIAGVVGLIPMHYFIRYLDIGFSAYQTAFIYEETGVALIDYHLKTVLNALSGVRGFNPVVEYLNDTGIAAGYNLTPTILGELTGSGLWVGLIIFLMITLYLKSIRGIWPNHIVRYRKYYAANFFIILGVMQSTLLDVFFYAIYSMLSIGVVAVFTDIAIRHKKMVPS